MQKIYLLLLTIILSTQSEAATSFMKYEYGDNYKGYVTYEITGESTVTYVLEEIDNRKTITIPDSVYNSSKKYYVTAIRVEESIWDGKKIVIPSRISDISFSTLGKFWYLDTIEVAKNNEYLKLVDGILYKSDMKKIYLASHLLAGELIIPDGVKEIGENAFNNTLIDQVKIPKSVVSIGDDAFHQCNSLYKVDFAQDSPLKTLNGAFTWCEKLSEISLPNSLTTINSYEFNADEALKELVIPGSVTTIKTGFLRKTKLSKLWILTDKATYASDAFADASSTMTVYAPSSQFSKIRSAGWNGELIEIGDVYVYDKNFTQTTCTFRLENYRALNLEVSEDNPEITIAQNGNMYTLSGYMPGSAINVHIRYNLSESEDVLDAGFTTETLGYSLEEDLLQSNAYTTLKTCTISITRLKDMSDYSEIGVVFNGDYIPANENDVVKIMGLTPNTTSPYRLYGIKDDIRYISDEETFTTQEPLSDIRVYNGITTPCSYSALLRKNYSEYEEYGVKTTEGYWPADNSGYAKIKRLTPNSLVAYYIYCVVDGVRYTSASYYENRTLKIENAISYYCSRSQSSLEFHLSTPTTYDYDEAGISIYCNYKYNKYPADDNNTVKFTTLKPYSTYLVKGYIKIDGETFYLEEQEYTTLSLTPKCTLSASSIFDLHFEGSYTKGDAMVKAQYVTIDGTRYDLKDGSSLDVVFPDYDSNNREHTVVYTVTGVAYGEMSYPFSTTAWSQKSSEVSFAMPELKWSDGVAEAVSEKATRLRYSCNLPNGVTGTGIEWRRISAPDEIASTSVACPVVDGQLVGMLKNLKDDVYYKFRPYYTATSGTKYYGDWVGIFTGDVAVFFTPEVKTFAGVTNAQTVTLSGYALEGSESIISQGFEYRPVSTTTFTTMADGDNWKTVTASGISMTAEIDGLLSATEYAYRAFVTTASGTYYGEEQYFISPETIAGIDDITADDVLGIELKENPVHNTAYLKVAGNGDVATIFLYNMQGSLLTKEEITADGEYQPIRVEYYPAGLYILHVLYDGKQESRKIVIK